VALLECVVNVSSALLAWTHEVLLDVHRDAHHNRSVFTMGGAAAEVEAAGRALASEAVARLDLRGHEGVHPRFGVVDVVPFVALDAQADAIGARDRFASWFGGEVRVPCFLYGPERTLPDVRRGAFETLAPDAGPTSPHVTAGACAVGARGVLVAYNVWLAPGIGVEVARSVAAAVRSPAVRALGFEVGGRAQVSCNLVAPSEVGPADVFDAVAALAPVDGAELVGLVPEAVLRSIDRSRWGELGLSPEQTIEARLSSAR
jgi:glutamate formiminotransferase